jgi:hypothetical protein
MTHPTEPIIWLVEALGKSGECAETVIFARARMAGLNPRQVRAAARELGVERYQGARSVMWRLPRDSGPMPPSIPEPHPRPRAEAGGHV